MYVYLILLMKMIYVHFNKTKSLNKIRILKKENIHESKRHNVHT